MNAKRTAASLLLGVLLAACVGAPTAPTPAPASPAAPSPSAEATSSPAAATSAATPTPTPTPTPRPVPPATVAWTELASIDVGSHGNISGARALAGGYVAWGIYATSWDPPDRWFATWFSSDGRTWERTIHSETITPCPGWTERQDLEPSASAGDGRTLVIMATLLLPDAEVCYVAIDPVDERLNRALVISLSTTDGRTWARSQPFGPQHGDPEDAWAIPGGWEASVDGEVWRSRDLDTWYRVASAGFFDWVGGAAPDGTRLAVSIEAEQEVLLASTDSVTWRVVRSLPADFVAVGIAPPSDAGRPWLVATEMYNNGEEEARVLVSTDLQTWQSSTFPRPGIGALTATRFGWIAIGYMPGRATGCGDTCRPSDPRLFTSADGVTWLALDPPPGGILVGDDPGLLAIGWGAPGTESEFGVRRVWRMTSGEK